MDDFKNEYDDSTNVIVELNKNVEDTLYDEDKVSIEDDEMVITKEKKKKPQKNKKKFSFKNLTKKQKIIFIVSISLIILVIAFILVYFLVIKKDKKVDDNKDVCAIAVTRPGNKPVVFEDSVECVVAPEARGTNGFGYDPIILYEPMGKTMAEMSRDEKNSISHRGKAVRKFEKWLNETDTH